MLTDAAIILPDKLAFKHTVQYPTLPCERAALEQAEDKLSNTVHSLACIQSGACQVDKQPASRCMQQEGGTQTGVTAEATLYTYEEDKENVNVTQILLDGEIFTCEIWNKESTDTVICVDVKDKGIG